ncbi:MAG: putative LPS assembly protein LptD [Gemmatimonas sp.]
MTNVRHALRRGGFDRVLALGLLLLTIVCNAPDIAAQVTPPVTQPPTAPPTQPPPPQPPSRPDSIRADSIRRDSLIRAGGASRGLAPDTVRVDGKLDTVAKLLKDKVLFQWEAPDSTMQELDKRPGYRKVQFQGDSIRYDARTGLLQLGGKPSAVKRDETELIGPVIIYDDSAKKVQARAGPGDSVTLRDPSQRNTDDFIVKGGINYDLESKSASVGSFETSVEAGADRLYLQAKGGQLFSDTLVTGKHVVWASDGSFTYCDLTEPHFHFTTKSMKFVSDNIMVARPGILYIGEVPVFWIPFFFQDVRKGRRSGFLTPNFGIAELLRNSPSYRRQVSNIGYYLSINDYMGSEFSFDWRSGANGIPGDQGFVRANLETTYRWLNRGIDGRLSTDQQFMNDGSKNLAVTWNHNQVFSSKTRLNASVNWVQNTSILRQTTLNPIAQTGNIGSRLSYQTALGPLSVNAGGSRTQFSGRKQVDTEFPSLNITSKPLAIGNILSWTPTANVRMSGSTDIDNGLQFPFSYSRNATTGLLDSTRIKSDRKRLEASSSNQLSIFGWNWSNDFRFQEEVNNYPAEMLVQNVNNPADSVRRVYSKTFISTFNWDTRFSLPAFFRSTFAISPTLTFDNVESQGGLFVRTERSGGKWVGQTKRPTLGVSSSPTLFAILPGIGPVQAFRHKIAPTFTYNYSPAAEVSDEYLAAVGRTRTGYLGALASNRVGMGFSTELEGKLRAKNDTSPDAQARKVNFLTLNVSPLSWDFIRADTASTGISESNITFSARSDLLPGLDFRTTYSLFQGDPMSDTSYISLYRTDVSATFSLNGKSAIFGVIGRLLGIRGASLDDAVQDGTTKTRISQEVLANQRAQTEAAGSRRRGSAVNIPQGQGWSLNLSYAGSRQRPPVGATVLQYDPKQLCELQRETQGELVYQQCIRDAITNPAPNPNASTRLGQTPFLPPPTQSVQSNLTFNVTPSWSAQWQTSYDIVNKSFASHQVGLQRQLHDWTTTFSFTQAPNGAFSFAFFIALKAQPSLKFDYNRATLGSPGGSSR